MTYQKGNSKSYKQSNYGLLQIMKYCYTVSTKVASYAERSKNKSDRWQK